MSIQTFSITDNDAVQEAARADAPPLIILAGPNGVGKSTLLESLYNGLNTSGLTHNRQIETDNKTKPVCFSSHRVPVPASVEGSFLIDSSGDGYLEALLKASLATSPNVGGSNHSHVPTDLRIGTRNTIADLDQVQI